MGASEVEFRPGRITLRLRPLGTGPIVACDGSAGQEPRRFGACAAVAMSGRAKVSWFEIPGGSPRSQYVELQALSLALRLTRKQLGATIRSDCALVLEDVQQMVNGGSPHPRIARWCSPGLLGDLIDGFGTQQVTLQWDGPLPRGNEHLAAATPLGLAAHKLAITTYRLIRDGFDPAAEIDVLKGIANAPSPHRNRIRESYDSWRTGRSS